MPDAEHDERAEMAVFAALFLFQTRPTDRALAGWREDPKELLRHFSPPEPGPAWRRLLGRSR